MNENIPTNEEEGTSLEKYNLLAEKLSARVESLPFPSLKEDSYWNLKAESDTYPDCVTHIDDLIKRFEEEGIKVVIGPTKRVYILPFNSDDIRNDSIFPRHLEITQDMDEDLKMLIETVL
jgi:hypothetical protein